MTVIEYCSGPKFDERHGERTVLDLEQGGAGHESETVDFADSVGSRRKTGLGTDLRAARNDANRGNVTTCELVRAAERGDPTVCSRLALAGSGRAVGAAVA